MPLNYSKWDQLELSSDSDIEVHPNVDKKSFIRMKQRQIHEKREERKGKIAFLKSEIELNNTLEPRIDEVIAGTSKEGSAYFERKVAELAVTKNDPNAARPPTGRADQPSYDDMVHALMTTVADEVRKKNIKETEDRSKELEKVLREHRKQLSQRTEQCHKEIEAEEAERRKHITSEDLHDGFSVGHVNKNAATAQIVDPVKPVPKLNKAAATKVTSTEFEVLNPKSSGSQADAAPHSGYAPDSESTAGPSTINETTADDDDDEDEEIPTMSPAAKRFSQLQPGNWEAAFKALSVEPTLLQESVNDAILMEAFEAGIRGDLKYAEACVHQALVLQYCRKLGRDGVTLFFKRMATNKDALRVFQDDVRTTWQRIKTRSGEMAKEREEAGVNGAGEREQIQLVAQDESTTITFEVPDGPPPENLTLTGEGSEEMDVEKVREFLQKRWDIFESFPKNFKSALQAKDLTEVNRVLGRMSVDEGEETVRLLDEAGILSFSSTDIVDRTQEGQP